MAYTTDEWWSIDGVSLSQYAWNVESIGGRYTVPPMRGEDPEFPYVAGAEWQPKEPGPRTLTLGMWVQGCDPTTGAIPARTRLQFNDNWRFLRQLFWQPHRQFRIERRWELTDPLTGVPAITWCEGWGQLAPGQDLALAMTTRTRGKFTVDIRMAHPFLYGPWHEPYPSMNRNQVIAFDYHGDYEAQQHFYVDLVGPLTDPAVGTTATNPWTVMRYAGAIAAGETVTLDVANFVATSSVPGPNRNRTGNISVAGSRRWMRLMRGPNYMNLTASAGTGRAVIRYRPAYV